jgi:replicative DNA helicase
MSNAELALLGHLIGDGCTLPSHVIQYTTIEKDLAELVVSLATEVFGGEVRPRINWERNWYQVYLASTRRHTHNVHSAVAEWLGELGIFGLRSYEKRIPQKVFEQPKSAIALFLRHLWTTDGCIRLRGDTESSRSYPSIYYASSSERLARGAQSLLLRIGINARLKRIPQGEKGRDQYHVILSGKPELQRFINLVGTVGQYKQQSLQQVAQHIEARPANTNRDVIPNVIWREIVVPEMQNQGMTTRQMMKGIQTAYCGTKIYKQNVSRERAERIANVVHSDFLGRLSHSDLYWDEISAIDPAGETEVYDLTVDDLHNFIVNDVVAHNSIEQDADVVCFIYREEVYNQSDENRGIAELIVGKQRNGPTGAVQLAFLKEFTRFENMWKE